MDAKGNNHVMSDHASSHRDQGFRDFPITKAVHGFLLVIYLLQRECECDCVYIPL